MNSETVIRVEHVSKKYCKSLKRSMLYGLSDIGRNTIGLSSHPGRLRKKEFWAIDDLSFELQKGEVLGIIGPNGAGKSTLLKMLNGIFWPDKGKIAVRGKVGALIEVGAGFHPLLTGRENIYINGAVLGMSKKEVDDQFASIIEFADIGDYIDMPVKHYSSGMHVRLGFAVAIHSRPELLLIDEVLAVGDFAFQARCFNALGSLRNDGVSIVLVSHNMQHISGFCQKALLIKNGCSDFYDDVEKAIMDYKSTINRRKSVVVEKSPLLPRDFRFEATNDKRGIYIDLQNINRDFIVDVLVSNSGITLFQRKFNNKKNIWIKNLVPQSPSLLYVALWDRRMEKLLYWEREIPLQGFADGSQNGSLVFETEEKEMAGQQID